MDYKQRYLSFGRDNISSTWPDKRQLSFALASLVRLFHAAVGTNLPVENHNHMYVSLGFDIATADNPEACLSAYTAAINTIGIND